MSLFLFILIILLAIIIAGMYLYFNQKLAVLRQQLLFTTRNYKKLKEEVKNKLNLGAHIYVKYSAPNSSAGVTNPNVNLMLGPYTEAPIINKIPEKSQVIILDEAQIDDQTWFYVALPTKTNINSKGWIQKTDFNLIFSNESSIVKN